MEKLISNNIKIIKKIGSELKQETIDFMVKNRLREYGENTKDFENNEKESIFFFLKDSDNIKAFGMLKPVILYCDDKQHQIMGIGNIIAVEKSKGYGTILMNHVKNYLENNKYVGMGSVHGHILHFYEKCGFVLSPGLLERVVYVDESKKEHRRHIDSSPEEGDHTIFIFDKDSQLKELFDGNKEMVVKVPFW